MKILVLGISGMLGSTVYKYFSCLKDFTTFGTLRNKKMSKFFLSQNNIISDIDINEYEKVKTLISHIQPNFVINCVGAIKQLKEGNDPLNAIPLNSLLPHVLADACKKVGARLIHISTDCVFSGDRGSYKESDIPDAIDIYGKSKMLGEVDYDPCLTLRTSIIGHELKTNKSLICWFLSQQGSVNGFTNAIYSGLPTVELASIIEKVIKENPSLTGLYHVASNPISKYNLLNIVRDIYQKDIEILKSPDFVHDKSLDATRFNKLLGYIPPSWYDLVKKMYEFEQRIV